MRVTKIVTRQPNFQFQLPFDYQLLVEFCQLLEHVYNKKRSLPL